MGEESDWKVERAISRQPRFRPVTGQLLAQHRGQAESLEDVHEAIRQEAAFSQLRTPGIVLVPGEGHSQPNILIVGEAPGATENTAKRPFCGASGRILRSLITDAAGLQDADYFITNVVKYRPPGNRTPFPEEIEAAVPYLRREWSALGCPGVIVAVGAVALLALAPDMPSVTKAAGKPVVLKGGRALWPMFHPAYGMRNKSIRPIMEKHWTELGRWYREEF